MTWNSHGHHIPTSPTDDEQDNPHPRRARCGGTHLCKVCKAEHAAWLAKKTETTMSEALPNPTGPRYSSRPEMVEAELVTRDNINELAIWTGGVVNTEDILYLLVPSIPMPEQIDIGEYVVKDLRTGQFSSMTKQAFEAKFSKQGTGDSGTAEYKTSDERYAEQTEGRKPAERLHNHEGNWPHPSRSLTPNGTPRTPGYVPGLSHPMHS